jgi:hypothetical protein
MIGTFLGVREIAELRAQADSGLIALYNVETMGKSCLRVGATARADEIFEVVVDELKERGIAYDVGALIG